MEPLLILFGIALALYFLIAPGIAWYQAAEARRELADLRAELEALRKQLALQKREVAKADQAAKSQPEVKPALAVVTPPLFEPVSKPLPAPLPERLLEKPAVPPILPPTPEKAPPALPKAAIKPAISWEQFLGVKLFAWIGGLALFLGIVFFVKYAFEQNLISPALRTSIGFIIGGGLVAAGVVMRKSQAFAVLSQTLTATGVLILYGVTFAAHALYHFPAFGTISTFLYMTLITAGAFSLAVWMQAPVIAVLGMAGGFLTPIFVNSGEDNPWGLFSYILLLDLGLIAVARKRGWLYLMACGAGGTLLLEAGWFLGWFWKADYGESFKVWIPITVHVFFPALFAAASWWLRESEETKKLSLHSALGGLALAGWSFVVAFIFLSESFITSRPVLLNGYLFAINAAVLLQVWLQPRTALAQWMAALITFVHLAIWSHLRLTEATLIAALVSYLIFGLMHTSFALLAIKLRPGVMQDQRHGIWLGPIAILLVIAPMFALPEVSWLIWPTVLLLNLMTIAVAAMTLSLAPVFLALCITLLSLGVWLFRLDVGASPWGFLLTLGGFSLVFAAAGAVLSTRLRVRAGKEKRSGGEWLTSLEGLLPMASAALPFVLLIIATHRLHLINPTPVFTLGVLLSLGLLALMRLSKLPALGLAAMLCMWLLEYSWWQRHFDGSQPRLALGWFIGIASLFASYPFVWKSRFQEVALPWISSACSWLIHGLLIYLVCEDMPALKDRLGLVPALLLVPPTISFFAILKMPKPQDIAVRHEQLAWFGGVALCFFTLIFPIQFERQWITLGWALEGAALCWLFTRVPHPGLQRLGLGLLTASFVRLVLNPAVLSYQERSSSPIWNWFLYSYGIAAMAHFAAAWWSSPPRDKIGQMPVRVLLWSFGGVLLFLLVNIEIADYFTPVDGRFISIQWGGDFARSMTFSIAWALFALTLLIIGFRLDAKGARYAGIGLMGITLLKLFFHDLENIGSIYRIGALIVVAIIALGASFLYQRFYAGKSTEGD
jgi:Predicted membrane protein (DUF2339)